MFAMVKILSYNALCLSIYLSRRHFFFKWKEKREKLSAVDKVVLEEYKNKIMWANLVSQVKVKDVNFKGDDKPSRKER